MSLVIGAVTYNNLQLLERCFASWRAVPDSHLVVFDNGSAPEVVEWLKTQPIDHLMLSPTNQGLCVGRNRIIEHNRDTVKAPYILLLDSDVNLHAGAAEAMVAALDADPQAGIAAYGQANHGFPVDVHGYVEETSNECQMTRMRMWLEIGLFPETLTYYSSDSWKAMLANMHGWRTRLLMDQKGYDHYAHGSQVNRGVAAALGKDRAHWLEVEACAERYWTRRLTLGKGRLSHGIYRDEPGADWRVAEELFMSDDAQQRLVRPAVTRQFTAYRDVQALIALAQRVQGNYLEVGCHQGLSQMQLAFNFPDRMHYGVDYSGPVANLHEGQTSEKPSSREVGLQVRTFKNCAVFDCLFDKFDLDRVAADIGLAFYDADVTYPGVKLATEKLIGYFARHRKGKRCILAWHDYSPQKLKRADDPDWVQIGDYVRAEIAERFDCRFILDTNLAYMTWTP